MFTTKTTKSLFYTLILIVITSCNYKSTNKKIEYDYTLQNLNADEIVVYYTDSLLNHYIIDKPKDTTTNKAVVDSIQLLNNFLHHDNMNIYTSNFFSSVLADSVIIKDSTLINKIKSIFYNRKKNEKLQQVSDCLPDYRDLIIFYSKGKRIAAIKICFTCGYIKFSPLELDDDFEVTENAFDELENYFNKNIHKIKY